MEEKLDENKICLIISGRRLAEPDEALFKADYTIACDSGLDNADKYGIRPDLVVGDFDSVSEENLRKIEEAENNHEHEKPEELAYKCGKPDKCGNTERSGNTHSKIQITVNESGKLGSRGNPINYIRYPKEKDDTDTMIAVKHALSMGYGHIRILCAFGGRTDHSMANIQAAHYAAKRGAVVELMDRDSHTTVFADKEREIDSKEGCYLSVFSLSDKSTGVSIKGTKYELDDAELTNDYPLGVSNEFVNKKAAVSVKDGCLMVVVSLKSPSCI